MKEKMEKTNKKIEHLEERITTLEGVVRDLINLLKEDFYTTELTDITFNNGFCLISDKEENIL